jgi:uncharacterized protein YciI
MEYFIYCRDRPGSGALRSELAEAHWAFMDRYADEMIARGPTLTSDGMAATGSVHIVDLPDGEAAHVFAFDEPNYQAGVYGEVLVRRWSNTLGRTMWHFAGSMAGYHRFLIIARGRSGVTAGRDAQHREHHHYLDHGYRDRTHRVRTAPVRRWCPVEENRDPGRVAEPERRRRFDRAGALRSGRAVRAYRGL